MYSPKIESALIPKIYRLGKRLRKPMTVIVHDMLEFALRRIGDVYPGSEVANKSAQPVSDRR